LNRRIRSNPNKSTASSGEAIKKIADKKVPPLYPSR
jgi:hypothetical protein